MKKQKSPPRRPVQLHIDPAPAETSPEYTLEDIMNEFGGWTKRGPRQAAPEQPPEAPPEPEQPVPEQAAETPPQQAAETAPAPDAEQETVRVAQDAPKDGEKKPDLSAQTMRFAPVTEEQAEPEKPKIWTYKGEPAPQSDMRTRLSKEELRARERRRKLEIRESRRASRREKRAEQPERTFASPEEAYSFYCKPDTLRLRTLLCLLLTLGSAVLLALAEGILPVNVPHTGLFSALMLAVMLVQSALCFDVLRDGVLCAVRGRFDLGSLLVLAAAAAAADAVLSLGSGRTPYCTAVSVQLTAAVLGRALLKTAKYRTMKAVCSMPEPVGAVRSADAWNGMDCIFRTSGDRADFIRRVELPDAASRCARVYAPVAAVLTLLPAVYAGLRGTEDVLRIWAASLLAACPAGLFLSYARAFQRQSARLYRYGAAVAGWSGVRALSGECAAAVLDQDLFPAGSVTLNGMKIYSDRSVSQIIGYASAAVQTAGSGLMPLFDEMMHDQNGRHYRVDTFRRYEGGGLGAEIQGDVVLMGSIGFMKLMKVRMPDGTRLKQAVYLSINGDLAAVFALNYAPNAAVRGSLNAAIRAPGLLPLLATRDFMLTPQFLKLRYKLASDRMEFPTVEERARLSEPGAGRNGTQGALLARSSLESFLAAVTGARAMRASVRTAIGIALLGGLLGMLLLAFLTVLDPVRAASAASGWNLLLYTLLWLLPGVLSTGLSAGR